MGLKDYEHSSFCQVPEHRPQFTVEERGPIRGFSVNRFAKDLFQPDVWKDLTADFGKYSRLISREELSDQPNTLATTITPEYGALSVSPDGHTRAIFLDATPRLVGRKGSKLVLGGLSIKGCGLTGTAYDNSKEHGRSSHTREPRGFYGSKDAEREVQTFNELMRVVQQNKLPTPPLDIPIGYITYIPKGLKESLRTLNPGQKGRFLAQQVDKVLYNSEVPAILVRVMGAPDRINFSNRGSHTARERILRNLKFLYTNDIESFHALFGEDAPTILKRESEIIPRYYHALSERLEDLLTTYFNQPDGSADIKLRIGEKIASVSQNALGAIGGGFGAEKDVSTMGTICDYEELYTGYRPYPPISPPVTTQQIKAFVKQYRKGLYDWYNRGTTSSTQML